MFSINRRNGVSRKNDGAPNVRYTTKTANHVGGAVMVWGSILWFEAAFPVPRVRNLDVTETITDRLE